MNITKKTRQSIVDSAAKYPKNKFIIWNYRYGWKPWMNKNSNLNCTIEESNAELAEIKSILRDCWDEAHPTKK